MEKQTNARKRYALAVCLALAVLCPLARILLTAVWPALPSEDGYSVYYYIHTAAQELLWLLPALAFLPWRTQRIGKKPLSCVLAAAAVVCGALTQVSLSAARTLVPAVSLESVPLPQGAGEWALAALALVVLPAVCEEAFFRGAVTVHLMDTMNHLPAFILSTVLFAFMHGDPAGLVSHLAVSACCTLLMMSTGRVWPGMLFHMGYNALALALPFTKLSPWLAAAGIVPIAAAIRTAKGMQWKHQSLQMSKTDAALACAILIIEIAWYVIAIA